MQTRLDPFDNQFTPADIASLQTSQRDVGAKVPTSQLKPPKRIKNQTSDQKKDTTMTGMPADQIVINPDYDPRKITEANDSVAVMAFGRMNPPTTGHEKLIHKVESVASEHKGSAHIIASHSEGTSKDPLPQKAKIGYIKKIASKDTTVSGSSKSEPTIMHAAAKLHAQGHKHLVVVAGSDRVDEYHKLLHKYNNHPDHYSFKSINVVSAGHRDPDAEGVEGMSASKMRTHAAAGDKDSFKSGLPDALHKHADEIMGKVRSGMGINEENLVEINLETRIKRAMNLRRYRAKIQQYRKRAQMRYASPYNLHKKALRYARMALKQRLAGSKGQVYTNLPPAQKKAIDRVLGNKVKQVKQIAQKIQPRVTQAEFARMASAHIGKPKSGTKAFFKGKIQVQSYDALEKKAEQSGYPVQIIHEVFERGYNSWDNHLKTREQLGFERVNSFVNKGKTYTTEDGDLAEAALSYERYAKIAQLLRLGLVDDGNKRRLLSILNKLRTVSDVDKLQQTDKFFLADLFDDVMERIVDDNQLFNRMLYLLRRK